MTKIDDRDDLASLKVRENGVRKFPIILIRPEKCLMDRRTVPQERNSKFLDLIKVDGPLFVMAAALHFINAFPPVVYRRDTIFNSGGKVDRLSSKFWQRPVLSSVQMCRLFFR